MNYAELYFAVLGALLTMKVIDLAVFYTWWHWPSSNDYEENNHETS